MKTETPPYAVISTRTDALVCGDNTFGAWVRLFQAADVIPSKLLPQAGKKGPHAFVGLVTPRKLLLVLHTPKRITSLRQVAKNIPWSEIKRAADPDTIDWAGRARLRRESTNLVRAYIPRPICHLLTLPTERTDKYQTGRVWFVRGGWVIIKVNIRR